ncbi:hypothetical protein C0J52_28060 [Blattella germanica]|nr:hypothetical protein C0J52_28060 [Blattella germanica]
MDFDFCACFPLAPHPQIALEDAGALLRRDGRAGRRFSSAGKEVLGEGLAMGRPPSLLQEFILFDPCHRESSVLFNLDHYGAGGWGPPTPSSGPRWGPIPGSSSSTPGPHPVVDSPYRITCPVHSPYRFRFANGGPDYYGHQVTVDLN